MTDLARAHFEEALWVDDREFTPEEAWLDLIQLADSAGVLPVISFTDRWSWDNQAVADFFGRLSKRGHIVAHDKTRWRLAYQAQHGDLRKDYEVVWSIYPRRVAKQKGYHAYAATRKGRNGGPPVTARRLYEATLKYARAREFEEAEFIMHPATFFGPDERWKERHKPKTNSKAKGTKQWSRPTSRDLTKTPSRQTGTAKSRGQTKSQAKPAPKKSPKKKTSRKDPLGEL